MSFEGYPRVQPREEYSGMWGRIGYVFHFKSDKEAIEEANRKDSVWRAAYHMKGVQKGKDMSELSEIELDGWYQALKLATEYTEEQWIENETDDDVLRALIEREASTGNPDSERIARLNARRQELRM